METTHNYVLPNLAFGVEELVNYTRLKESNFRDYWLKRLIIMDEDLAVKPDWQSHVEPRPGAPVLIVSDRNDKEILYWCPPIVRTMNTFVTNRIATTIMQASQMAENMSAKHADAFVAAALGNACEAVPADEEYEGKQWRFILERYGYIGNPSDARTPQAEIIQGGSGTLTDVVEDDW